MSTNDHILVRMNSHNTLLCVGLDPDIRKFPIEVLENGGTAEEKVFEFLQGVVDVTGEHVCAYKAQKAFFDLLPGGHNVLKEIVSYIHQTQPGVSVIVDCKIGDIGNTMVAYIENLFGLIQADGIVINPYMGDDVTELLIELSDKAIVVLVKTSNVSGGVIQDVKINDGRPLWQYVLDLVVGRWNRNGNMIPVLASIAGIDMAKIRTLIPDDMLILLAGVGAQGGNYKDLSKLLNSDGVGTFVNSSRNILYPNYTDSGSWQAAIERVSIRTKEDLNSARGIL